MKEETTRRRRRTTTTRKNCSESFLLKDMMVIYLGSDGFVVLWLTVSSHLLTSHKIRNIIPNDFILASPSQLLAVSSPAYFIMFYVNVISLNMYTWP